MEVKYKAIYADCPWQYGNINTGGSLSSGSASKYSTMPLEEICSMNVPGIVDKSGCVLFLWATTPLLPDAFRVMERWGFSYKTSVYWDKLSYGMGYWFRGQVEQCLVGVCGNVKAFRRQTPNIIRAKPRAHSQKPEEIWNLIDPALNDHGIFPRLEMFCRGEPRPGWDGWGFECQNGVTLKL